MSVDWQPIETLPGTEEQVLYWAPFGMFVAPANFPSQDKIKQARLHLYQATGEWPNVKYIPTHWARVDAPATSEVEHG
jgi:hypothetical protein